MNFSPRFPYSKNNGSGVDMAGIDNILLYSFYTCTGFPPEKWESIVVLGSSVAARHHIFAAGMLPLEILIRKPLYMHFGGF